MTQDSENTLRRRELLAGSAIKIRIAIASILVLAVGSWLTPPAAQRQVAPSQERAAPLLEEQVQQREASLRFVGVQDVAAQVREHSVAIMTPAPAVGSRNDFSAPPDSLPAVAGFGVYISDTHVLAHGRALDGRPSVPLSAEAGRTMDAHVVAYEPSTGLVLLRTEPAGVPPVTLASEAPVAGELAVGVGRSEGHDVAVPVFVTAVVGGNRYTIGAVNESVLPGMPVFTLGGELFAIAVPDGDEIHAVPAREAADRLLALAATGERRSSLGLGFQAPTGLLARTFGERGVVITDVVEGGPADLAGIQAGDVLLRVGDVEIDSVEAATQALGSNAAGTPVSARIQRANRVREMDVTPALAYAVAALADASGDGATGPEARVLFTASVLQQSAIPPTARVLTVNGRPATSRAQAQRALQIARTPVPILLRQGNNRFFVAVDPTQ